MPSISVLPSYFKLKVDRNRIKKNGNVKEEGNFCFYECVRPVLLCCKVLGFLPLHGFGNSKNIVASFSWKSFYTFFYLPNLMWTTIYTLTKCYDKIQIGLKRNDISGFAFSVNTLVSSLLLLKLSLKWNKTMRKIEKLESLLSHSHNPKPLKVLRWIVIGILSCGLVEFLTYLLNTAFSLRDIVRHGGPEYCFRYFFTNAYDWFFNHISFNCCLGIVLLISKVQAVGLRNLTDIFVISVTVYLCTRFAHFNQLLLKEEKKSKRSGWMPWSDLQKHYTRLTHLVLLLDDLINPFVFVSFSCNILFICKQLFKIIQSLQLPKSPHETSEIKISKYGIPQMVLLISDFFLMIFIGFSVEWEPVVYLALSTTFVTARATLVSLLLAHHHTLTRQPLNVLHTVPASVYNLKMQRFMDQVFNSKLSLSGFKFFYVTRESILSMIATLVKYELVLLQFPER